MSEKAMEGADLIISAKGLERTYELGEVKVRALRGIDLDVK